MERIAARAARAARTLVPQRLRGPAKAALLPVLDQLEVLTGRRDRLTPPRRMWAMVGDPRDDLPARSRQFVAFLIEQAHLKSSDHVLDVGCGIGMHAVALTEHLSAEGRYEGLDIVPEGVDWCRRNITPRRPNFRFQRADLRNSRYNPDGRTPASEYVFPYPDGAFDLVFLTSVFTHLLRPDMERYVAEIARVLKPGGRCVASFYLLNDARRAAVARGSAAFAFAFNGGGCRIEQVEAPEAAVAFEETDVLEAFRRNDLSVDGRVIRGTWAEAGEQGQDIVIATRVGPSA